MTTRFNFLKLLNRILLYLEVVRDNVVSDYVTIMSYVSM